jgi:predicted ATPase
LLAVVLGETEIDGRLAAMQALDLIRLDDRSSDYAFKHALVRDALYQSLLTEHRQELHSKIAQEIERRGGNRLGEVAEVLAHHYNQTIHTNKAFVYLSMAGVEASAFIRSTRQKATSQLLLQCSIAIPSARLTIR